MNTIRNDQMKVTKYMPQTLVHICITRIRGQDNILTLVQHILSNLLPRESWRPLSEGELADHVHDLCCSYMSKND